MPLVLLVPLVCSVIAGTTLDSSMADLEAVAARELRTVRLVHCLALVLVPVLAMVPSGFGGLGLTGHALATRNVIGYLGLTYLAAVVLGARIGWVLPVTYAFLAATLAVTSSSTIPGWGVAGRRHVRPGQLGLGWSNWPRRNLARHVGRGTSVWDVRRPTNRGSPAAQRSTGFDLRCPGSAPQEL